MSQFFTYLNEIKDAVSKSQRDNAQAAALQEIGSVNGHENWDMLADEHGDWLRDIPHLLQSNQERAKRHLKALVKLTARRNKIVTEDTAEKLLKKIKRCKSVEALAAFEEGELSYHPEHEEEDGSKVVYSLYIPLDARIERLQQQDQDNIWEVLRQQRNYLNAKRRADKIAWPLTVLFCLLSVGVVSGVAMVVGIPGLMSAVWLVGLSAVIGYVDVAVFYPFIKRSLRNLFVRGVFQAIDNNLLNQLAKEENLKDRHDFSEEMQKAKLGSGVTWWWRRIKYGLVSVGGLLTIAATIGSAGLAYAQIAEVLPLIGITTGIGLTAIPWVFAILSIPYFFLMFDNVYRAIKNNIFKSIWEQVKEVFQMKDWATADTTARAMHLFKCLGKAFMVAAVFVIVVIATIFSAGATLQGCASFFSAAFGMANKAAEAVGVAIGSIQLLSSLSFNIENCFKTVSTFFDMLRGAGSHTVSYVKESAAAVQTQAEISLPRAIALSSWLFFFRPIIKFLPLFLHIAGLGMLSAQGLDTFAARIFGNLDEKISRIIVASSQATSELLEDLHTLMPHDHDHSSEHNHAHHAHHHEKVKHDCHEHADPAADVEWVAEKAVSAVKSGISFFSGVKDEKAAESITLVPVRISP